MQIVRTIVWVVLLMLLLAFSYFNWRPVEVQIWDNLVLETKIPALVVVAFLLGLVPMWLIHRGSKWRLQRRVMQLENTHRATVNSIATPTPVPAPPPSAPLAPEPVQGAPVPRDDILG